MSTSRQGTGSSWETEVLEVADRETLYNALFKLLAEEGYFSVDARTLQSPKHSPTSRDRALAKAVARFVHTLPSPVSGREKMLQRSPEFDASRRRLDALLTGCSEGLLEYIRATPTLAYSYWPARMIVDAKAREGWQLTMTESIVVRGTEMGTAYTFRRTTSSTSSPKGGGILFDFVRKLFKRR